MATTSETNVAQPGISASATKLLFLPELLEKILNGVQLCDVFQAAGVCRSWKVIFEGSHSLQVKAQLKNDPRAASHEHDFDAKLGLFITSHYHNSTISFELGFAFRKHAPIQLTKNLRKCFATQPSCQEMSVGPLCCLDDIEYIVNEKGVTIGDVVDAARRVYDEHEHCQAMVHGMINPSFQSRYPMFSGQVQVLQSNREIPVEIFATAPWTLPDEDPAKQREASQKANEQKKHKEAGWLTIWHLFHNDCQMARIVGEQLPTWPVFLAQNRHFAPRTYQLNEAEAGAADFPRRLTSIKDGAANDERD